MTMSAQERSLFLSAEQAIRPPTSGRSSAGGVPDSEPLVEHSSGTTPNNSSTAAEFLRTLDLERALIDLERKTAGRTPTRAERRLAAHYRRQLGHDPKE